MRHLAALELARLGVYRKLASIASCSSFLVSRTVVDLLVVLSAEDVLDHVLFVVDLLKLALEGYVLDSLTTRDVERWRPLGLVAREVENDVPAS